MTKITVRMVAVDGAKQTRRFETLSGAAAFARRYVGATPEIGGRYAVSGDGVCRVTVEGATLADLFPTTATPVYGAPYEGGTLGDEGGGWYDPATRTPTEAEWAEIERVNNKWNAAEADARNNPTGDAFDEMPF